METAAVKDRTTTMIGSWRERLMELWHCARARRRG